LAEQSIEERAKEEFAALDEERRRMAKAFSISAVVAATKKIYAVQDIELGTVKYGLITLGDSDELAPIMEKAKSGEEKSLITLWWMLKKAYPNITLEDVKALPLVAAMRVFNKMQKEQPNFHKQA
jgi:hypothetical protein